MAVAENGTGTARVSTGGGATTADLTTYTVDSGSNLCLIAFLFTFTNTTTNFACNWDQDGTPQAMTMIMEHNNAAFGHAALFRLVAPTTGNLKLRGTWTGGSFATLGAIAFSGVDQTTPIITADNVTYSQVVSTASYEITSGSNDATFGTVHSASVTIASTDTQTEQWRENDLASGGSYGIGGSSNTHTWTLGGSALTGGLGIHIQAAAATAGPVVPKRQFNYMRIQY